MKIGQFCHFVSGGGVSALPTNLNNWINKNTNYQSTFLFNDFNNNNYQNKNFDYIQTSKIENQSIYEIYFKYKNIDTANFCFFYLGLDSEKIKIIHNFDIIHIHWINYFMNLDNLKYICTHKPVVITVHDQHLLFGGCHWRNDCNNFLQECNKCPQIKEEINEIVHKNFLRKKNIFDNSNVTFVHQNEISLQIGKDLYKKNIHKLIDCTVDTNQFYSIHDILPLKKKYNIPINKKIILSTCGYNSFTKGIWQFDELESRINNDSFIILIGSGYENIPSKKNRILNLGHINKKNIINDIYNLSDVTFTLSREEGVPGIACESLSCGTPFIGFHNVGNLNRMIKDNFNGYLVKNFSINEFAKKINNIRSHSKDAIRIDYLERFDKNFYSDYINLYRQVTQNKNISIFNDNKINFPKVFETLFAKNLEIHNIYKKKPLHFLIYYFKNFRDVNLFFIKSFYNYSRRNKYFIYLWRLTFSSKIKVAIKNYIKKIIK